MNNGEVEAIKSFNEFAANTKLALTLNGFVVLPGLGTLTKQFSNTWSFSPQVNIESYYPVLSAERVVRAQPGEHTLLVGEEEKTYTQMEESLAINENIKTKDNWVPWSVIFAGVGIVVIIVYYLSRLINLYSV